MIKRVVCLSLFGLLLPAARGETFTACGNLLSGGGQYDAARGSTYVPMDSWIYPAMDRLHALGEVDIAYSGMRPWTRLSIVHMLEASELDMGNTADDSEACSIYHSLKRELQPDVDSLKVPARPQARIDSTY